EADGVVELRAIDHPGDPERRRRGSGRRHAGSRQRVGSAADVVERRVDAGADDADRAEAVLQEDTVTEAPRQCLAKPSLRVKIFTRHDERQSIAGDMQLLAGDVMLVQRRKQVAGSKRTRSTV